MWVRSGGLLTVLVAQGRPELGGGAAFPPSPEPDALPLFQQPQPRSVEPKQGPQAGGTTLTINGTHLDTGSEEDVRVTLNDVPCNVWVSPTGRQILVSPGPGDRVRALWP